VSENISQVGGQNVPTVSGTPAVPIVVEGSLPAGTNTIGAVTEANLDASVGAPGSAVPSKAMAVGGTDGTDLRVIKTDTDGTVEGNITKVGGSNVPAVGDNTDGQSVSATGLLGVLGRLFGFNGTSWDRLQSGTDSTAGQATTASGLLKTVARMYVFNGGTWDRLLSDGSTACRIPVGNTAIPATSTTVPLAANGTFSSGQITASGGYGTADSRFARITGSVYADQPGTLYIQQSFDGTNWDVQSTFSVSANTGQGFSVEVVAPYVRVYYVNGATAQTVFRLYTQFRMFT